MFISWDNFHNVKQPPPGLADENQFAKNPKNHPPWRPQAGQNPLPLLKIRPAGLSQSNFPSDPSVSMARTAVTWSTVKAARYNLTVFNILMAPRRVSGVMADRSGYLSQSSFSWGVTALIRIFFSLVTAPARQYIRSNLGEVDVMRIKFSEPE